MSIQKNLIYLFGQMPYLLIFKQIQSSFVPHLNQIWHYESCWNGIHIFINMHIAKSIVFYVSKYHLANVLLIK